jgi:hypothetical protein
MQMRRSLLVVTMEEGQSVNIGGASVVIKRVGGPGVGRKGVRLLVLATKDVKISRHSEEETQLMLGADRAEKERSDKAIA